MSRERNKENRTFPATEGIKLIESLIITLAEQIRPALNKITDVFQPDRQSAGALLSLSLQGGSPLPKSSDFSLQNRCEEVGGIVFLPTDAENEHHNPETSEMKS